MRVLIREELSLVSGAGHRGRFHGRFRHHHHHHSGGHRQWGQEAAPGADASAEDAPPVEDTGAEAQVEDAGADSEVVAAEDAPAEA